MPNWVPQHWSVSGLSPDEMAKVRSVLTEKNERGEDEMTFEGFAPMPAVLHNTLSGYARTRDGESIREGKRGGDEYHVYRPFTEQEEAELAKPECHGARNWYDWQVRVWGDKWGPCDAAISEDGDELVFEFMSPWGPPEGAANLFREWLKAEFGEGGPELHCSYTPDPASY